VDIRRRLFIDESSTTESSSASAETSPPTTNGAAGGQPTPNPVVVRPANRAGSLHLLFRKFYKLASVRIQELCKGLSLQDPQISSQIWTIFENSIVERTQLLKDRHLDQIIMCAIYVFIRVKGGLNNLTFRDIMSQYRNQPQSASQVYRSVFIKNITPESAATCKFLKK
jgi:retinoblastoma-like protein 1